jgi:hypothetical protein
MITFPNYGFFFEFFKSPEANPFHRIANSAVGFLFGFKYAAHTFISFNRFTTFCLQNVHEKVKRGAPPIQRHNQRGQEREGYFF